MYYFKVILVVKIGDADSFRGDACSRAQRQFIQKNLMGCIDAVVFRIGFIIQNPDLIPSYLQNINVAGNGFIQAKLRNLTGQEIDRDFYCDGRRVVHQHELLQHRMPVFVLFGQKEGQFCQVHRIVIFGFDSFQVKIGDHKIRTPESGLKDFVRAVLVDLPQVFSDLWKSFGENVGFEAVELEGVFLVMLKHLSFDDLFGRKRKLFAVFGERA